MENSKNRLKSKIISRQNELSQDNLNEQFKISFNPFPRSGISDLNSSDDLISQLEPVEPNVEEKIHQYVVDTLFPENPTNPENKYLSAVIRGDYGYGKTQTLLYTKVLLESFASDQEFHKNPFSIYIQNPGAKLTELIGSIISQIGEENFRKYLWNEVLENLKKDTEFKEQISELVRGGQPLLENETEPLSPFSSQNTVNYKKFWDYCIQLAGRKNKRELDEVIRVQTIKILTGMLDNSYVANYFHEILLESVGISKKWENLTSGTNKELDKRELYLIKAILKIVSWQGYDSFYILVDEFEAVAEGRLSNKALDDYLTNLRTLIDRERNWFSVFAMTNVAFERIRSTQPPLAQRIAGVIIDLNPLNYETAQRIVINYLNFAREESESLYPFDEESIETLRTITKGIPRVFLKSCFTLIQRGIEELENGQYIKKDFVKTHIEEEFE